MSDQSQPQPAKRSGFRDRLALVGLSFLLTLIACYAATWFAAWNWRLDLTTHFPLQRATALLPVIALLLCGRAYRSAVVAAGLLAFEVSSLVPFYLPANEPHLEEPPFRGVTINVLRDNAEHARTIGWLRSAEIDFFAVQEMTPAWREALAELESEFSHVVVEPREGSFGIGLFSRRPILESEIVTFAEADFPSIVARIDLEGGPLTVIATHPPPPVGATFAGQRNDHFVALAQFVRTLNEPAIVVGDLNVTPWSPHFRGLLRDGGLVDGRLSHGLAPTWPAALGPVGIPIDHVLVTPDLVVTDLSAGPNLDSDHRPVRFEFSGR